MSNSALLGALLVAALPACSSLKSDMLYEAAGVEHSQEAAERMGMNLSDDDYKAALDRWPWASGTHLQRRTLILSLMQQLPASRRGSDELARRKAQWLDTLDRSRDSSDEIEIMNQLLNKTLAKNGSY